MPPAAIRFHVVGDGGRGKGANARVRPHCSPERHYCSRSCWRAEAAALDLVQRWFSRFSVRFPGSVVFGPFVRCPAATLPRPGKPSVIRLRLVGRLTEPQFRSRPTVRANTDGNSCPRSGTSRHHRHESVTTIATRVPAAAGVALSTAAGNTF